jgi:hypothetical protein
MRMQRRCVELLQSKLELIEELALIEVLEPPSKTKPKAVIFMSWAPSRGLTLWLRGLRGG